MKVVLLIISILMSALALAAIATAKDGFNKAFAILIFMVGIVLILLILPSAGQ